jgi:hypothetical protein
MARPTALERFWLKVDRSGDCWLWTAHEKGGGYGGFYFEGREWLAHKWSYEHLVGAVPEGLELDHLCHTWAGTECAGGKTCIHRRCVNPDHLEPVTRLENILRGRSLNALNAAKTHCLRNHAYTPENTGRHSRGTRFCRICKRTAENKRRRRIRQDARAA